MLLSWNSIVPVVVISALPAVVVSLKTIELPDKLLDFGASSGAAAAENERRWGRWRR